MREGWICPRCKLALAPHINFCDCRDKGGEAGQPAVPIVTPDAPGGGISITPQLPYVVTNTGYQATSATTTWTANTAPIVFGSEAMKAA